MVIAGRIQRYIFIQCLISLAMTLGIIATLALGVGLMALMYYSNRSGRD